VNVYSPRPVQSERNVFHHLRRNRESHPPHQHPAIALQKPRVILLKMLCSAVIILSFGSYTTAAAHIEAAVMASISSCFLSLDGALMPRALAVSRSSGTFSEGSAAASGEGEV
jgi:hypothetical protein